MAASKIDMPAPQPFKVIGENTNLAKSWDLYLKRFDYYVNASGVTKDDQKKAMLLHLAGEEVQDIFETLGNINDMNFGQVKGKLSDYFKPQKNIHYERHAFRSCKQEKDEKMDNYIIRLKKMAISCDYPEDSINDMIRDQIVDSCQSTQLRKKFLKEKELTLTKIQDISRASDLAEMHSSKMDQTKGATQENDYAYGTEKRKPPRKQYQPRQQQQRTTPRKPKLICFRCGYEGHSGYKCLRSRNVVCSVCHKKNHFSHMCRSKSKQKVNYVDENSEIQEVNSSANENEEISGINHVFQVSDSNSNIDILIEGKSIQVIIDSGASVNCMDKDTYNSVKTASTKLEKSSAKIYPYASKIPLKLLGVSQFNVVVNGKVHKLIFHIIDGQCKSIIGLKCALDLGLLKLCVNSTEADSVTGKVDSILHEYKDRFEGLGKLKDFELKLHIDRDIQPVAQSARKMPFKMREQVKNKLNDLLDQGIIEKVEGPTEWLSPDIEGCKNISDDIIIYAKTQEEHDQILRKVLQRLRDKNLTLNPDKCIFSRDSISFMGHTLTSEGLKPQDSKIQAVLQTERPTNVKELKSFLGLVSYCSKFVPQFATICEPMRKLTRRNQSFQWEKEQQDAFETLKNAMISAEVMAYYDQNAETRIICDASPVGLGCILEQKHGDNFRPVAYASRTLNAVERRYSQIEREALGITWGIERFQVYLYGIDFTVITDHKPLINIFKPNHKSPSARMTKWLLRLQPYKFTVEYQPGTQNASDCLSRSPNQDNTCTNDTLSSDAELYINYCAENSVPKAMTLEEIENESSKDELFQKIRQYIETDNWTERDKTLTPYFKVRSELSVQGNLILRGSKLVIPRKLQARVLSILHETHQGIYRSKALLREKVWWAGISNDVERLISNCSICQRLANPERPPPVQPTELPNGPWEKIGIDLTGPFKGGYYCLVIMDYYSRYPEVEILKSITSASIINKLIKIFSTHGYVKEIISDNGKSFVSKEMETFLSEHGIKHRTVTPYWARANGLVENFNKTLKKAIQAACLAGKDWKIEIYKFLLTFRTTPSCATDKSPSSLHFQREIRTKLPSVDKASAPRNLRETDARRKAIMKKYADRRLAKDYRRYRLGQKVLILHRQPGKLDSKWEKDIFTVTGQFGPRLRLLSPHNQTFFRHVCHVKPYYQQAGLGIM